MQPDAAEYCVYLTMYRGGALPPFYIGSTSRKRLEKGYCGSVVSKRYRDAWKSETQKNPAAFTVRIIASFSDRTAAYDCERRLQKRLRVISNPLYANRSYGHKDTAGGWNLGVPAWNKGKRWSQETVDRIKAAKSITSEITRQRMSDARKGKMLGENNPAKRAEVREKIKRSKVGTKPVSAGWNKGRTGVYSAEVRAAWSKAKTGVPNPAVVASNKRRAFLRRHPGGGHPVA